MKQSALPQGTLGCAFAVMVFNTSDSLSFDQFNYFIQYYLAFPPNNSTKVDSMGDEDEGSQTECSNWGGLSGS